MYTDHGINEKGKRVINIMDMTLAEAAHLLQMLDRVSPKGMAEHLIIENIENGLVPMMKLPENGKKQQL